MIPRNLSRLVRGLAFNPPQHRHTFQCTIRLYATSSDLVHNQSGNDLIDKSYLQLFREQIHKYPHKDMFRSIPDQIKWTYEQAFNFFESLAAGLLESGGNGPLATALPLRIENFAIQYAAARSNKELVLIPPGASSSELVEQLKAVNPSTFVWPAKIHRTVQLDEIYDAFPYFYDTHCSSRILDSRFPNLRHVLQTSRQQLKGMYSFSDIPVKGVRRPLNHLESELNPTNPKITILTPQNKQLLTSEYAVLNIGNLVGAIAGINEEDVLITTLPFHKGAGLSLNLGLGLTRKPKIILASDVFDVEKVGDAIRSDHCTAAILQANEVVPLFQSFPEQPRSLKKLIVVSSPDDVISEEILSQLHSLKNVDVTIVFGTDETGGVITATELSQFDLNSLGKPLPQTSVNVVNGNLTVRGFNVTSGYKNDPDYTRSKISQDGWLNTGIKAQAKGKNISLQQ